MKDSHRLVQLQELEGSLVDEFILHRAVGHHALIVLSLQHVPPSRKRLFDMVSLLRDCMHLACQM